MVGGNTRLIGAMTLRRGTGELGPPTELLAEGFDPTPTIQTIRDGDWHTASTWDANRVPNANDWVQVDHQVTNSADINFWTLYISNLGRFTGTGAWTATITDKMYEDTPQFDTGWITAGYLTLTGTSKTAWTRTTAAIAQGATSIVVSDATGWQIGDRLVLPDTRQIPGGVDRFVLWSTPEIVAITSIAGGTIGISPATAIAHPASRDGAGTIERYPPVGNLTRSIVIKSPNPAGTRGHTMFADDCRIAVSNVSFQYLGRTTTAPLNAETNHRGRYATHIHFCQTDGAVTLTNCAIESSTKWGTSIHESNGQTITHNVVYDAAGWGIGTEDGNETDNLITDNLVCKVIGTGGRGDSRLDDWGHNGTGFWFQGPFNIVKRNIATNSMVSGFAIWSLNPDGSPLVNTNALNVFEDNEAIASGNAESGGAFTIWYVGTPDVDGYVDTLYDWNCRADGPSVYMYPTERIHVRDWTCRGDYFDPVGRGYFCSDYVQAQCSVIRASIHNKAVALEVPRAGSHGSPPMDLGPDPFEVVDCEFLHNATDVDAQPASLAFDPAQQDDITTNVRNPSHLGVQSGGYFYFKKLTPAPSMNLRTEYNLKVFDFNGNVGEDYVVYAAEQDPSAFMPQTGSFFNLIGSVDANKTNQQNHDQHGYQTLGVLTPVGATGKTEFRSSAEAV